MKKFYAIAALLLLGATAVQAQEHQTCNVKDNEVFGIEMGDVEVTEDVEATPAERAAMKAQIKAAPATGEAYYYRPAGTFFVGVAGTTAYGQAAPRLVAGPYRTYTFMAQEADSYAWKFQLNKTWYPASSKNVNVKFSSIRNDSVPTLTVGDNEYHVFGYNNNINYYGLLYSVPRPIDYIYSSNAGAYYASPKYFALRDRDNTGGCLRHSTGNGIGYNGGTGYWFGYNTRGWNGMATYVEAPQSPYLLHGGAVRYGYLAFADSTAENNDVPIKIDVYKVTTHQMDTLALGEKLASATYTLSLGSPASGGFLYEFEEPLVVDSEIAVVASGYDNPALRGFSLFASRDNWDEGHGQHGYILHVNSDGTPTQSRGVGNFFSNATYGITAPSILLDVEFPFMVYYYTSVTNPVMHFTPMGECTSAGVGDYAGNQLAIWASSPSANWTVSGEIPSSNIQLKAEDGGDVPEWIHYEIEDNYNSNGTYSRRSIVTITTDISLTDVSRSAILSFNQPGAAAPVTLTVTQSGWPTSINGVDAARTVENISYYNLAGVESATPFQGVNIEVKKYNDGSKEVTKVVR